MVKIVRCGLILLFTLSWLAGPIDKCTAAPQTVEVISNGINIMVFVNGNLINFADQKPYINNNRTMVPINFVSAAFGARISWDSDNQNVTINGGKEIKMAIGSLTAMVDKSQVNLDTGCELNNNCLIVPLNFVSTALGAEIKFISPAETNPGSTQEWLLDVDISDQKVRIYQDGKLGREWLVSTGRNGSTPLGWFTIQNRGEWFFSEKYQEGAMWWVSFKDWGIYLFHSIPMDRQRTVIETEQTMLGSPASHGCVRLDIDNAKWIYDNVPQGTPVYIHI